MSTATRERGPAAGAPPNPSAPQHAEHEGTALHRRRGRFSPWGELYGTLLQAEAHHRGLGADQHAVNVRHRASEGAALLTAARQRSQERRERVLRYPDLAERLRALLGLSQPSHWNGYVPPRTLSESACSHCASDTWRPCGRDHYARTNTSPVRAELVAIAAEAKRREDQGD